MRLDLKQNKKWPFFLLQYPFHSLSTHKICAVLRGPPWIAVRKIISRGEKNFDFTWTHFIMYSMGMWWIDGYTTVSALIYKHPEIKWFSVAVSTDETTLEAGIRVQIHSQDEPPYIHELGFGVSPGFQTFVSCQEQRVCYSTEHYKICFW